MATLLHHDLHAVDTDPEQVILQGEGAGIITAVDPLLVDAEVVL